jgi:Fungal specific transcription factor domain
MKSSSQTTNDISKESRYRVWWSLYSFEHLLGVMTGRATCILDGVCTTPMPIPFEEERFNEPEAQQLLSNPSLREERIQNAVASYLIRLVPLNPLDGKESDVAEKLEKKTERSVYIRSIPFNTGLLFLLYIDITVITQEIVNKVYTPDAVNVPWAHIENRIGDLKARIDLWFKQLPDPFRFTHKDSSSPEQVRAKLGLAFQYYSARIALGRPCLCRRDASSNDSHSFSRKMALVSLEAAMRMLDLIPNPPDPFQLYQLAPWWCILHYLMQATTVLLLELSFANIHAPEEETNTFHAAKKAIRWLYAMSKSSTASLRAWQLCDGCMRRIAIGMNYDVSDLPPSPSEAVLRRQKQSQARQQQPRETGDITQADTAAHSPTARESEPFAWSFGMEPLPTPQPDAAKRRELIGDLELDQTAPVTAVELVTYPLSFSPLMMNFGGSSGPSTTESHFPYDPITDQFMGSFFPNPGDDQQNWED